MFTQDPGTTPATAAGEGDDTPLPVPDLDLPQGVTSLGRTLVITGDVSADEHLIIEGTVEGHVTVPEHGVAIGLHAHVSAEVMARTVTVLGHATGVLTASDKVELRDGASVTGRIVATRVAIEEGAFFQGAVDPTRTEAALAVGRHRLKQRRALDTTTSPAASS